MSDEVKNDFPTGLDFESCIIISLLQPRLELGF